MTDRQPASLTRIPRRFYDDHRWRDLDTPRAWKETKRHIWIDPSDSALSELVSDAEHYAHPYGPDDGPQLATAARALLRALNRQVASLPRPEPKPCEGEYCAIDSYHEWVSEARGEAMMGAVTQGYSIDGGHPHEAANEAVRGTTAPKPCSLCKGRN